jgi:hypothetical protein
MLDSSILISIDDQEVIDYKCDFEDRKLAESVRFFRSPVSCRVFHICAFFNQYTLTCPLGLYFDENLDTCNFESAVNCSDSDSSELFIHSTRVAQLTSNVVTLTTNIITNSPVENLVNITYNTQNETVSSDSGFINLSTTQSNIPSASSDINNIIFSSNQNSTQPTLNVSVINANTITLDENYLEGLKFL